MLHEPTTRAGRGKMRIQKPQGDASAQSNGTTAVVAIQTPVRGPPLLNHRPQFQGKMNMVTLRFHAPNEEEDYRKSEPIASNYRFAVAHFSAACLALFAFTLISDGLHRGSATQAQFDARLISTGIAAALSVMPLLWSWAARWRPLPEHFLAIFYAFAGAAWAVASVISNDSSTLPLQSNSSGVIVFLVAGHMLATFLSLVYISLSSAAITVTYIVVLAIMR